MKLLQIMTVTALIVASASALHSVPPGQAGNTPSGERRGPSTMSNTKVIMLIEAKIQPQRRAEIVEAAQQYISLVRAEPGVEAFYLSTRQDDPNTFVFYEVYKSQAAQDFHLQQDFTRKFLATLKSAQAADRVRTRLVDVAEQAEARSR
ncbi:MAG TPA: putative quinol monooxygenase [Candidatus Angelobacter sp.]|jgi:quinol monooxygenase YgiN